MTQLEQYFTQYPISAIIVAVVVATAAVAVLAGIVTIVELLRTPHDKEK